MVLAVWQRTIVDEFGNIAPTAVITVRRETAGAQLADLYADRDGLVPLNNPFTIATDGPNANNEAFAQFFVAGGAYRIDAVAGGDTRTWRYEAIGTAAETDALEIPVPTPAQWEFDSATTAADPGSQEFRLNNADPTLATELYLSETQFSADGGGVDATTWLETWDDAGSASVRGVLEIFDASFPTEIFHRYRVSGTITDSGAFKTIALTWLSGQGSFTAGEPFSFSFWNAGPTAINDALFGDTKVLFLSASSTQLTSGQSGYLVSNVGSDRTVQLPAPAAGLNFAFFSSTGNLTISTIGSEIIALGDGTTVSSLQLAGTASIFERMILVCDGTNWIAYASNASNSGNLRQGRHTISIPAGAMYTPSTAGAASATTELVASAPINALRTLAFDANNEEAAFFMIPMPKSWDGGNPTAEFLWTAISGSGAVVWSLALRVFSEGDPLEAAFGTQQDVTDTLTTAGDMHVSSETAAITPAGTPANDSVLFGRISREAANASDTLAVDALLMGIRLFIVLDDANDA